MLPPLFICLYIYNIFNDFFGQLPGIPRIFMIYRNILCFKKITFLIKKMYLNRKPSFSINTTFSIIFQNAQKYLFFCQLSLMIEIYDVIS